MSRKRKRHARAEGGDLPSKKSCQEATKTQYSIDHPLGRSPLPLYYIRVSSLRQHLLSRLPQTSRSHRRRVLGCGNALSRDSCASLVIQGSNGYECDAALAELLDTTIVGYNDADQPEKQDESLVRDFEHFSQSLRSTATGSGRDNAIVQSDVRTLTPKKNAICDFAMHATCEMRQKLKRRSLDG